MPRRDGTGPLGIGMKTGRIHRFCNVQVNGFGYLGGYGCVKEYRRRYFQAGNRRYKRCVDRFDEKEFLANQEAKLENELKLIKERLVNLNKEAK
ncbi:DUF5320 domain-containing protein [Anaerosacchariphilus polymeriproducens]|uniref:DUF5320 domain-containing protein n=1 Tax=Anaerosacchariphilus polymeriproducens TaxID=1812858 RepID=A0A371AQJ0_9FIRM|nr:DUF5320 domain-containing protein [Anaerosacchariphilus polymeriproducens]RDU21802.1 hypothetical protein DWV06_17610 [Anaerosacchariphilus polymeriproducens]